MVGWVMTTYHPRTHSRGLGLPGHPSPALLLRPPCAVRARLHTAPLGVRGEGASDADALVRAVSASFFGRAGYPGSSSLFYHRCYYRNAPVCIVKYYT